jgi:two-component system sporulation sensor kinase A
VYHPLETYKVGPLELAKLLEEVHVLLATQLKNSSVKWKPEIEKYARLRVNGVADQLKQVFLNISLNAIEAMAPSGGDLMVSLVISKDRRQAGIRFRDTGPGIAPDVISKLYEPFHTTKDKGLGLGLPICYDIVQRHDGRIDVDSQLGKGATFTVWLPVLKDSTHHETK